jgi:beta-galactosidase
VRIEDKEGNLCPDADNLVHFSLTGNGSIAAVDNGNAATVEPFQADHRKAFHGLALLIVRPGSDRSRTGRAGQIHIVATGDGLAQGRAEITTEKAAHSHGPNGRP